MTNEISIASELHRGSTLADFIITAIGQYPQRTAFANDEATITYQQLGHMISRIAQYFDSLGLKPGDTVAQLCVNRFEVFAIIAAVYLRGLRSVTLHAMSSEDDHQYVLNDCKATIIIVDAYHEDRGVALKARCPNVKTWLSLGLMPEFLELNSVIQQFEPKPLKAYGDSETIVRIAYTGGTTGRSKGVLL